MLLRVSVAELAESLQAEVLCCSQAVGELVESLMIGAMCVDSGEEYFARKANKAVIARGDRPDMHLAALATSTRCLIISGGVTPTLQVLQFAEEKGIPILSAKKDVLSIVNGIEEVLLQAKSG